MTMRRLIRHYSLATYYGADKRVTRLLATAVLVVRARLKYGIGPLPFALYKIASVSESTWSDYIVKQSNFEIPLITSDSEPARRIVDNKGLFFEHCLRTELSTIPIICRIGGTPDALGGVVEHVTNVSQFNALLRSAPPRLFIKPISSAHGNDAFVVTRRRCGGSFEFDGCKGTGIDLFAYLNRRCDTQAGFVIQPLIRPHARMRPLASEDGLPTVRVVTAMCATGPEVLFACLKIPVGTNIIDNFANGAGGNLIAGVDLASGMLTSTWGSECSDWPVIVSVDSHPDSGYRITGSQLPFWQEIVEATLRGQRSLPDLKTIGWDVAITADGVVLVEANSKYGVDILQIGYQRGVKLELAEKLNITIA